MTDREVIDWIQAHANGFSHRLDGRYSLSWFDDKGLIHSSNGMDLIDAVQVAKAQRKKLYIRDS